MRGLFFQLLRPLGAFLAVRAAVVDPRLLDACPGYNAKNVLTTERGLTADLFLAGQACNIFGTDLPQLKLEVVYQTGK